MRPGLLSVSAERLPTARFLSWRQVQALLRENAQLRGDKVPETAPDGSAGVGHGRSTLTAADVVTNRLVTFTSIAEIQQKNLELLEVQCTPRLARTLWPTVRQACVALCRSFASFRSITSKTAKRGTRPRASEPARRCFSASPRNARKPQWR